MLSLAGWRFQIDATGIPVESITGLPDDTVGIMETTLPGWRIGNICMGIEASVAFNPLQIGIKTSCNPNCPNLETLIVCLILPSSVFTNKSLPVDIELS